MGGPKNSVRRYAPVVVLALAAGGLLWLGVRGIRAERALGERAARNELAGSARETAGALAARVANLAGRAASGDGPSVVFNSEGDLLRPSAPRSMPALRVVAGRDFVGSWFLDAATSAEREESPREDPLRLYQAATGPDRDPRVRAAARHRIWTLLRRREATPDEIEAARVALLAAAAADDDDTDDVGLRSTREGLVARAAAATPDDTLVPDLLACLGGPDDVEARGLLALIGLADAASIARREEELARVARARALGPHAAAIVDDHLIVAAPGEGGRRRVVEESIGALPAGRHLFPRDRDLVPLDALVESVPVDPRLPGVRVAAVRLRPELDAEASGRAGGLAAALALFALGGGAALLLTLRAARREADAARAQAAFLARVGHDLRTPLARLRLFAETLAEGRVDDPAEAREFALIVVREAERLSAMVATVLDLARLEEGHGALAQRRVDLVPLAEEVAESLRPLVEDAGMKLAVTSSDRPLPVRGDPDALRGALGNVLENAMRHAATGHDVEVETRAVNGHAELRVLDRGPGLPTAVGERIFERFVRGPNAPAGGAGLGLALVREVARAHGGTVRADAREGGGAAFTIELPIAADEDHA